MLRGPRALNLKQEIAVRALSKRAQSSLEYTLLIIIILGVFVATSVYVKRGLQGNWKRSVDDLGDQYDPLTAQTGIVQVIDATSKTEILTEKVTDGIITRRFDSSSSIETVDGFTTMQPE